MVMEVKSFGGFISKESIPKPVRNSNAGRVTSSIAAQVKKCEKGKGFSAEGIFPQYSRSQLQIALHKAGARVYVTFDSSDKPEQAKNKKGKMVNVYHRLFIYHMTDAEWKEYNS